MDNLDTDHILEIGLKYISIESKLGELGRVRSIFKHLSQFFNPSNEFLKCLLSSVEGTIRNDGMY